MVSCNANARVGITELSIESGEVILKYIYMIATVLWFILMTYLSHQNGTETAETSLKLAEFLGNTGLSADLGELNGWLRRAAHVVVFLVFSVLLSLCLRAWDADWRFVFLVLIWAVVDEATKPLIEGRHFAWFDVGLNEVGSAVGILIGFLLRSVV